MYIFICNKYVFFRLGDLDRGFFEFGHLCLPVVYLVAFAVKKGLSW